MSIVCNKKNECVHEVVKKNYFPKDSMYSCRPQEN